MKREERRYSINGNSYGNLKGLAANQGERIRWYLFSNDQHQVTNVEWKEISNSQGISPSAQEIPLQPDTVTVIDKIAEHPGQWLLQSGDPEKQKGGMYAGFTIISQPESRLSAAPDCAFLGMPQSLQTLRIARATVEFGFKHQVSQLKFEGSVSVPEPFCVATSSFTAQLGAQVLTLKPDSGGLYNCPEGSFLITNLLPYGNGIVEGGTLKFDLILRGNSWLGPVLASRSKGENSRSTRGPITVGLTIGKAHHVCRVTLRSLFSN